MSLISDSFSSVSNKTIIAPDVSSGSDGFGKSKSNVGAIVGGVVGGVALISIVAIIFFWRKRKNQHAADQERIDLFDEHKPPAVLSHYQAVPTQLNGGAEEDLAVPAPNRASVEDTPAHTQFLSLNDRQLGSAHATIPTQEQLLPSPYVVNAEPTAVGGGALYASFAQERPKRSKAQETAIGSRHRYDSSISTTATTSAPVGPSLPIISPTRGSQSPSSASVLPAAGTTSPVSASQTDVLGLRQELENLRRAMEGMRRPDELEPPPQYTA